MSAFEEITTRNAERHAHHPDTATCTYCGSFVSLNDGRYYCGACGKAGRVSRFNSQRAEGD